ncbi:conserved hypothetical protein, partial [Ricinus communis]
MRDSLNRRADQAEDAAYARAIAREQLVGAKVFDVAVAVVTQHVFQQVRLEAAVQRFALRRQRGGDEVQARAFVVGEMPAVHAVVEHDAAAGSAVGDVAQRAHHFVRAQ